MQLKRHTCQVILRSILATLIFAVVSDRAIGEETVSLKYKLKVGDLFVYQMKLSSHASGGPVPAGERPLNIEGTLSRVVTEVSKEGFYSLLTLEQPEIIGELTPVGRAYIGVSRQKISSDGSILKASGTSPLLAEAPLTNLLLFSLSKLPEKPVKKGESWNQEVKIRDGGMSIQWTLVGFQKVKGYDCSQLEVAFLGSPRVEMKLTYFFAIKEGFMVSLKGESKVKLTPPPILLLPQIRALPSRAGQTLVLRWAILPSYHRRSLALVVR